MFPNVRLIVVAILAAITGIGCGLGLFATFRINHEPLARLAEGSPPLQLAFDNRALGSDARTPMEARLPVNGAAKVIPVPVIIATPSPAAEQAGADFDDRRGFQRSTSGRRRHRGGSEQHGKRCRFKPCPFKPCRCGPRRTIQRDARSRRAGPARGGRSGTRSTTGRAIGGRQCRCGRSAAGGETDKIGGEQSGKAGGPSVSPCGASAPRSQGGSRPSNCGNGGGAADLPIFTTDLRMDGRHRPGFAIHQAGADQAASHGEEGAGRSVQSLGCNSGPEYPITDVPGLTLAALAR